MTWCGPHNLPDLGKGVESPRPRVAGENRVMVWTTEGTARSGSWGVSTIEMAPDPQLVPVARQVSRQLEGGLQWRGRGRAGEMKAGQEEGTL